MLPAKKLICILMAAFLLLSAAGCASPKLGDALDIVSDAVDDMMELEPTPEPSAVPAEQST